eukprot:GHVU01111454.1.p1 GENE.GHVU01111454.1~~GHVU01111454.1.p1  ORF type:complete len:106 (-),score=4.40 GHVU01111454.1:349-666(-)
MLQWGWLSNTSSGHRQNRNTSGAYWATPEMKKSTKKGQSSAAKPAEKPAETAAEKPADSCSLKPGEFHEGSSWHDIPPDHGSYPIFTSTVRSATSRSFILALAVL